MDGGETDTGQQGAGVETAAPPASSSSDDAVSDLAVGEGGGRGGAAPAPAPASMIEVVVAISMKRRRPRTPRPRRRRAVVRPPGAAAGSDHGAARRTKKFMQWKEWYLRKQRREKEMAWLCYAGWI